MSGAWSDSGWKRGVVLKGKLYSSGVRDSWGNRQSTDDGAACDWNSGSWQSRRADAASGWTRISVDGAVSRSRSPRLTQRGSARLLPERAGLRLRSRANDGIEHAFIKEPRAVDGRADDKSRSGRHSDELDDPRYAVPGRGDGESRGVENNYGPVQSRGRAWLQHALGRVAEESLDQGFERSSASAPSRKVFLANEEKRRSLEETGRVRFPRNALGFAVRQLGPACEVPRSKDGQTCSTRSKRPQNPAIEASTREASDSDDGDRSGEVDDIVRTCQRTVVTVRRRRKRVAGSQQGEPSDLLQPERRPHFVRRGRRKRSRPIRKESICTKEEVDSEDGESPEMENSHDPREDVTEKIVSEFESRGLSGEEPVLQRKNIVTRGRRRRRNPEPIQGAGDDVTREENDEVLSPVGRRTKIKVRIRRRRRTPDLAVHPTDAKTDPGGKKRTVVRVRRRRTEKQPEVAASLKFSSGVALRRKRRRRVHPNEESSIQQTSDAHDDPVYPESDSVAESGLATSCRLQERRGEQKHADSKQEPVELKENAARPKPCQQGHKVDADPDASSGMEGQKARKGYSSAVLKEAPAKNKSNPEVRAKSAAEPHETARLVEVPTVCKIECQGNAGAQREMGPDNSARSPKPWKGVSDKEIGKDRRANPVGLQGADAIPQSGTPAMFQEARNADRANRRDAEEEAPGSLGRTGSEAPRTRGGSAALRDTPDASGSQRRNSATKDPATAEPRPHDRQRLKKEADRGKTVRQENKDKSETSSKNNSVKLVEVGSPSRPVTATDSAQERACTDQECAVLVERKRVMPVNALNIARLTRGVLRPKTDELVECEALRAAPTAATNSSVACFRAGRRIFKISADLIKRKPNTWLCAALHERAKLNDPKSKKKPIIVNRKIGKECFAHILDWYRNGEIFLDGQVSASAVLESARILDLPKEVIVDGCLRKTGRYPAVQILQDLRRTVEKKWRGYDTLFAILVRKIEEHFRETAHVKTDRADSWVAAPFSFPLWAGENWADTSTVCNTARARTLALKLEEQGYICSFTNTDLVIDLP